MRDPLSDLKLLRSLDELAGKTVRGAADNYCEELLIVFTDGTALCVSAAGDYDGGATLTPCDFQAKWYAFDSRDLVRLGLLTQEQADEYKRAKDAESAALEESRERAEYERLRARFEKQAQP